MSEGSLGRELRRKLFVESCRDNVFLGAPETASLRPVDFDKARDKAHD